MAAPSKPGLTCLGQLVVLVFIIACIAGAGWLFFADSIRSAAGWAASVADPNVTPSTPSIFGGQTVEIGVAYGTEKREWLKNALARFEQDPAGKGIKVHLIPMGSVEGGNEVVKGNEKIHVWSPASRMYATVFSSDFEAKYAHQPFVAEETLALSPMVFVFWQDRYEAFAAKYAKVDFHTLAAALDEPGGWGAIASKPEWGLFKLGHTNPAESNSGLMTIILMAQEFRKSAQRLSLADIMNPSFGQWLRQFQKGVSGLPNSTGNMMKEMVLKGPSVYDVCIVYENTAIDFIKAAEGRWGAIRVVYPAFNVWNDNPYYILDVPWSSPEQRAAAKKFLEFLMSEPMQQLALAHGFRPGDPKVPVLGADSPFTTYAGSGIGQNVGAIVEFPPPEVISNLLIMWNRSR
jgi:ABC-type Fe3+ transport system substrate-binding protein